MTHFTLLQLDDARYAGSVLQASNCSAPASGRWEDVCLKAIVVTPSDVRGRIDHRFNRDHRESLAIAYEVIPKRGTLDHQACRARHSNGADSDEDHTL